MPICDICEEKHSEATQSCSACNKVIVKYQNKTKYPMAEVRKALKHAYSHKNNNESFFKCCYTGIIRKFNSKIETVGTYKDAFTLTLDHKNPHEIEIVVSLNIINKMKGDIPSEKFKEFVIALGEHFKNDRNNGEIENQLRKIFE